MNDFHKAGTLFFNTDFKKTFEERMGIKNLQKRYGGLLPNKKSNFFPPQLLFEAPDAQAKVESAADTSVYQDEL